MLLHECSRGHQWQGSDSADDVCPNCGAPAETVRMAGNDMETGPHITGPGSEPAETIAGDSMPAGPTGVPNSFPKLEGYVIEKELGRGGMGVVYKAKHLKLERSVAIKMILGVAAADPEYRHRFQIEVRAVAQLQHPNVVQIFEVDEHEGQPYSAFEFLEGGSLDDKYKGKPQPFHEAAKLIETLARGIHAAHEQRIVHRDLKPANILFTKDGTAKISDFGLAKRVDSDIGKTQTGMIMGTPGYMAPEQASGHTHLIGPPADIYALGAMLYELLTGRPPFVANTGWDVISKVVAEEPRPPSTLRRQVPRDLETICLRCLEKSPDRRYSSAAELADELRRFLDGDSIQARPVGRFERTLRWARRNPGLTSAVAMMLVVVGVFGGALAVIRNATAGHGAPFVVNTPLGLPPVTVPGDNPLTVEKVALGKQLFFDPRLSKDNSVSCGSCHMPSNGYGDGLAASVGIGGQKVSRNSPTIVNSAYWHQLFWDGRAHSLEEQALGPLFNPAEMGLSRHAEIEERLNAIPGYRKQFQKVFQTDVTTHNIAKAIAAFERTLVAGNAPFDRFKAGDESALSEQAQRGLKLFLNKAHCSACHVGPSFSDGAYHNLGVSINAENPDIGRQAEHNLLGNRGAFKTPSLRDIARSAPYMHDGSIATLEEVVEFYNRGGTPNDQLDEEIFPLNLTDDEKQDLVTFLKEGLTSDDYPEIAPPKLP